MWFALYSIGVAKILGSPATTSRQAESALVSNDFGGATQKDSINKGLGLTDQRNMVLVQGGSFQMGSETNKPIHLVKVPDFFIDKYEVTVAEYRKFCSATRRSLPSEPPWGWKDDHPVVGISWKEAADYATWVGKRLPTEAEWEFAARGGVKSMGFVYSGSGDLGEVAWYHDNSDKTTHPVGTKAPNEQGLYDMSGNAAEWCADWYGGDYYSSSPMENPLGPKHGAERVVRGGSFIGDDFDCKVTFRTSAVPGRSGFQFGFRCVMSK